MVAALSLAWMISLQAQSARHASTTVTSPAVAPSDQGTGATVASSTTIELPTPAAPATVMSEAEYALAEIDIIHQLVTGETTLNYRNLDDLPQFKAANTTTEFLAKYLFDRLAEAVRSGELGREPSEIAAIRVTISESPLARASYEASLR